MRPNAAKTPEDPDSKWCAEPPAGADHGRSPADSEYSATEDDDEGADWPVESHTDDIDLLNRRRSWGEINAERAMRGFGYWGDKVQAEMRRRFPNKPRYQIDQMIERYPLIPAGTGKTLRPMSDERLTELIRHFAKRFINLFRSTDKQTQALFAARPDVAYPNLRNVADIGHEHVKAFLYWVSCRYRRGDIGLNTTEFEVTCCRRLLTLLGKRELLPCGVLLREYLKTAQIDLPVPRWLYPTHARGLSARGVNYKKVLARIPRRSLHIRRVLWLKVIFGLRVRECVRQKLAECLAEDGLRLKDGGKGGLARFVPFPTHHPDWRTWRRMLRHLVAAAKSNSDGLLMPQGTSLEQARGEIFVALSRVGVHKRAMGITSHGVRHDAALEAFFALTGLPAPALRRLPYSAYMGSDGHPLPSVSEAMLRISRQLGHKRRRIAEMYVGSVSQLRRESRAARVLAADLHPIRHLLDATPAQGLVGAFLLDRLGNYDYHVVIRFQEHVSVDRIRQTLSQIKHTLATLGRSNVNVRVDEGHAELANHHEVARRARRKKQVMAESKNAH